MNANRNLTVDDQPGTIRPSVEESTTKRPSWKAHGSGRALVKISVACSGGLDIEASETPEELRGAKQVYVGLSEEGARALYEILKRKFNAA